MIESPIKSKQKYFISIIKQLLMFYPMFTDFVCFQFYFRDYVAQPCLQIGTAYISFSIKHCHEKCRDAYSSTAQVSVL